MGRPFGGFFNSGSGVSGSVAIGQFVEFPAHFKPDILSGNIRYLKAGYIETDVAKFDNTFWELSRYTIFQRERYPRASDFQGYQNIVYANGKFVTGCLRPIANPAFSEVLISSDGINWVSARTGSVVGETKAGGGLFLTGFGGYKSYDHPDMLKIATSQDGVNWAERSIFGGAGFSFMYATDYAYGKGLHVVILGTLSGSLSHYLVTSPDGVNWNSRAFSKQEDQSGLSQVAFGNGIFLTLTQYAEFANSAKNNMYRSADTVNWIKVNRNFAADNRYLQDLRFFQGYFYINARLVSTNQIDTFRSVDGIAWELVSHQNAFATGRGVDTGNGYLLWDSISRLLYRSQNGLDYYATTNPFTADTTAVGVASDGAGNVRLTSVATIGTQTDGGIFSANSYLYAGSKQGGGSGTGAAKYVRIS